MSQSIRFLGLAIFTWAMVRAVSLGIVPGTEALAFDASASQPRRPLPPIRPSRLPLLEPVGAQARAQHDAFYGYPGAPPPYGAYPVHLPHPVYLPARTAGGQNQLPHVFQVIPAQFDPREVHFYGSDFGQPDRPPQLAMATPVAQTQVPPTFDLHARPARLDRLSLTAWSTMRSTGGPDSLAGGGTLGGSEAGARLMWRITPKLSAAVRGSAPINSQRGAEAALGVRYQPMPQWPIALTIERRQGFRDYGQSAFAAFAEGGLYGRPMPWQSTLDGYVQAGVVDFNDPDWFVDGQAAITRPVWRNLSGGFGLWGAAQPGLSRLDAGPRLSLGIGRGLRTHVDYRFNLSGNARPGSGAVVTLAGDF